MLVLEVFKSSRHNIFLECIILLDHVINGALIFYSGAVDRIL